MNIKLQATALFTLVQHELNRMLRIYTQVFLPPVITTLLYFLIFGTIMGQRIGFLHGVSYAMFIAPGLIIMAIITNAYSNVSASVFIARFQRSIEELYASPLHPHLLLLGYVLGGILRGCIVAVLVFFVATWFMGFHAQHWLIAMFVTVLIAALFALAGFANGLLASNFEELSFVPTFILSPLAYLSGIFYSVEMLPLFWQNLSHFNPMFYMVALMRYALIGTHEVNVAVALCAISALVLSLVLLNMILIKKGRGRHS